MQVQTQYGMDLMESWTDECIRRLEEGEAIENVKQWVKEQKEAARSSAIGSDPYIQAAIETCLD
jgi:hypothetical protein